MGRSLENLYIPCHRFSNERYRYGWDRVFGSDDTDSAVDIEPDGEEAGDIEYPDGLVLDHFC